MASIAQHLAKILNAVYGKDVRTAIHASLDAINTEVEDIASKQVEDMPTRVPSGGDTASSVSFPITIEQGGTGATTASDARTALSVYSKAEVDAKSTGGVSVTYPIALAKGGTGATNVTAARTNLSVYSKAEVDARIENAINPTTTPGMVTDLSTRNVFQVTISGILTEGDVSTVGCDFVSNGTDMVWMMMNADTVLSMNLYEGKTLYCFMDERKVQILPNNYAFTGGVPNVWAGSVLSVIHGTAESVIQVQACGETFTITLPRGHAAGLNIYPGTAINIHVSTYDCMLYQ